MNVNYNQSKELKDIVIGLDCSTTAAKAFAFDKKGKVVVQATESFPLYSPQPGYYEQDANDWWTSAKNALRKITRQIDPKRVAALSISNQRETFVPLNNSGEILRPAIIWLDERCKDVVEPFAKKIWKDKIHRITGKPADYAPVVYRLAWMKKYEPALFKRIGMICDVHTYITRKLTGSYKTSWASADPLGLFDLKNKKWSPVILNALVLNAKQLPETYCPGTFLGKLSQNAIKSSGLKSDALLVAGGGDGQCAGLGSNVLTSEKAYLNLGTAVVAGVYGTQYKTSKAFRTMAASSGSGYYYECSLRAGTFGLVWFIEKILNVKKSDQPEIYRQLEKEAGQIEPGSSGLMHLPYLCGVMNPYWDINARGAFIGLSSSHHRGHFYRSILEGIAFEQLLAINAVEIETGTKVKEFIATGGGSASNFWLSIIADITGKVVCVPENKEASALGAAIAAAVGAGWYKTFEEAAKKMTRIKKRILPSKQNHKKYLQLFSVYKKIYPALKS
jgi:sugar (pentulose or hexulose) kinase